MNKEKCKNEIIKHLKAEKKKVELLNGIGTVTKKDGGHFAAIERNFTNCVTVKKSYADYPWQKELYCRGYDDVAGHVDVSIDLFSYDKKRPLTVEEVLEEIKSREKMIEEQVSMLQSELDHFDDLWNEAELQVKSFSETCEKREKSAPHIQAAVRKEIKWNLGIY